MADATASRGGMGSALTVLAGTLGAVTISVDGATASMKANTTAIEANIAAVAAKTAAEEKLKVDLQEIADRTMMHTRAMQDQSTAFIKSAADAAAWGASLAAGSKITGEATIELSGLSEKLKEAASAALQATDAFGRVAGGLTAVSAQADHATDGLQGVAWEMVHATQPTVTLTTAQNALIESLAKVSDAGGASSLWVGHLIAQLKNGEISFDDFRKQVNATLQGLTVFGSVMGNTAFELNAINTLLSSFKNNAAGGWPGSTTAPYSNPSSPLTGKP